MTPAPAPRMVPPPLAPGMVWRGTCAARCAFTGRRCVLPAGHAQAHATGRGSFSAVLAEGAVAAGTEMRADPWARPGAEHGGGVA